MRKTRLFENWNSEAMEADRRDDSLPSWCPAWLGRQGCYTVVAVLLVALLLLPLLLLESRRLQSVELSSAQIQASRLIEGLRRDVDAARVDTQVLAKSLLLSRFLVSRAEAPKADLEGLFGNLMSIRRFYDQARVFDTEGMEALRVNFRDGEVLTVVPENLQSKSDRYYVQAVKHLKPGELYQSPFDLNVENGEVERPFQPQLRYVVPIYNTESSSREKLGYLVLNVKGSALLERVHRAQAQSPHRIHLLNDRGYWLVHPEGVDEWGFMFGQEPTFAGAFPDVWATIEGNAAGDIDKGSQSYAFAGLDFEPRSLGVDDAPVDLRWSAVTEVAATTYGVLAVLSAYPSLLLVVGLLMLAAVALAVLMARAHDARLAYQQHLEAKVLERTLALQHINTALKEAADKNAEELAAQQRRNHDLILKNSDRSMEKAELAMRNAELGHQLRENNRVMAELKRQMSNTSSLSSGYAREAERG